jgi:hypothetical protein
MAQKVTLQFRFHGRNSFFKITVSEKQADAIWQFADRCSTQKLPFNHNFSADYGQTINLD